MCALLEGVGMRGGIEQSTIIDELLQEQQLLTAVARFARHHDEATEPHQARYYRDLIPLAAPQPGEQYAFEVDLDLCSGCKACVTACHNLNGLAEHETWRSVNLLRVGVEGGQAITTACHHCVDPACLNGCPVDAYEKDPVTGIVKHLDDQCIGCQYCVLKCPYDVPRYNEQRGIVRKCDMCTDRLAVGEAPACVQACPNAAIRITMVEQDAVWERYVKKDDFLPGAPPSEYALPTTRYVGRLAACDDPIVPEPPKVEHAHPALVVMLVLTQLSVGMFCAAEFLRFTGESSQHRFAANFAAAFCFLGLTASIFHLGRPLYAFRAVIGLRHSWLSREVLVFALFAGLAFLRVAFPNVACLGVATVLAGIAGVFCSVMVYDDTRRPFWTGINNAGRFFGTVLVSAAMSVWFAYPDREWAATVLVVAAAKLLWELRLMREAALVRSTMLMLGALKKITVFRFALGFAGGVIGPALAIFGWSSLIVVAVSLMAWLCGELAERYLFFTAVAPPKMPGAQT